MRRWSKQMGRGRPRSSNRLWVERCAVLDAVEIGHRFERIDHGYSSFIYVETSMADGRRKDHRIQLTSTKPHLGGMRWWLVCPICGKRVCKLYNWAQDLAFACRLCRRLVYESQYRKPPKPWQTIFAPLFQRSEFGMQRFWSQRRVRQRQAKLES